MGKSKRLLRDVMIVAAVVIVLMHTTPETVLSLLLTLIPELSR